MTNCQQYLSRRKQEKINDDIKSLVKFKESKHPVKTCQSRQDGNRMIFYDINIEQDSIKKLFGINNIKDSGVLQKITKWNACIGRSHTLSDYARYKQNYEYFFYIYYTVIPAIEYAYREYCRNNLYGRICLYNDAELGEVECKKDTIDMFDEWFIGNKIESSFTKWVNKTKEIYKDTPKYAGVEPTDVEKAFIDYVEMGYTRLLKHCEDIINQPNICLGLKNWQEYIHSAENILHKRLM